MEFIASLDNGIESPSGVRASRGTYLEVGYNVSGMKGENEKIIVCKGISLDAFQSVTIF